MIKGYASNINYSPGTNIDPYDGGHHKSWSYISNLANEDGIAYCQHPDFHSTQPISSVEGLDNYEEYLIPGNNGTLHTPAPLDLTGFTFNFGTDERHVKYIIVHYKQQTFENQGDVIDMDDPTITLLGKGTSKKLNGKVTTTLTERMVKFSNVTKQDLLSNNFGIRIAYPMNGSARTCGRIILQDVYIEVVTGDSIIRYPQTNEYFTECGGNTNYKCWDNLSNLANQNGIAHCRDPEATDTPLIAGVNGTYNQPAPLRLSNFNFGLESNTSIEKVEVHYKQQTFINNGYYAEIGGATVSLLGTNAASQRGTAVGSSLTENVITFTGITIAQLLSSNFAVKIAYPSNTATTPGRIILQDVYVEVFLAVDATKLTLNSRFSKNPITVGETTNMVLTCQKTSNPAYNADIVVDLPYGVTLGTITCSDTVNSGTLTENGVNYKRIRWKPNLVAGNVSTTLTATLTAVKANKDYSDSTRASQLKMVEQETNISSKNYLKINPPTITISTNLYRNNIALKPDAVTNFSINVKSDDKTQHNKELHIVFDYPGEIRNTNSISNVTGVTSVDIISDRYIIVTFTDNGSTDLTIPLGIYYPDGGEFDVEMYVCNTSETNKLATLEKTFLVRPSTLGELGFTRVKVHRNFLANMGDGTTYTLGAMIKYTLSENGLGNATDYYSNLRLGIFHDNTAYLEDNETFLEKVMWSRMATTTEREATVDFIYNKDYPIYIVYSHTYTGDPLAPYTEFNFSEISICESSVYSISPLREWSLQPVSALLTDTRYARAKLLTTGIRKYVQPAICYDWDDGGLFTQDISPLGFTVMLDYVVDNNVMVDVELYLDDDNYGHRSILLHNGYGTATLGNNYDLFGMQINDFLGKLNKLQVRISAENNYDEAVTLEINNVRVQMMYVNKVDCKYGFTVDGVKSNDLGIVVTGVEYHFGTDNEKSTYKVSGTDNTIVNRLNVDSKEVKVRLGVPNCDMQDNIYLVDKIVELFTNNREINSNKPILKRIIFNHMPDREFRFVREKEFDDEWLGGSYKATITLYIPDGTTYDVNKTTTGGEGYVPASISLKPEVYLKVDNSSSTTRIIESCLNQTMIINSQVDTGDIILVDCENRSVMNMTTGKELSLDYNSTWFKIKGDYNFSCENCSILSVEYYLRR